MAAPSISRLPTPPRQPPRSFSRYSNRPSSYVYPHTDIHPLTLPDNNLSNHSKPHFDTTTRPTPSPPPHSIFLPTATPHPHPHSPSASVSHSQLGGVDVCLPRAATPSSVHVDPTYNAPLSVALAAASLDRFPLSALSANTLHASTVYRSRQAVEDDEEEGRRRADEACRVKAARQAARRRAAEEERRRREEADRRIQQLPLHVRQLVYQRWEETGTAEAASLRVTQPAEAHERASDSEHTTPQAASATKAANKTHCIATTTSTTMHVRDLDETALPSQSIVTQRPNDTITAVPNASSSSSSGGSGTGSRSCMSRDEQRLFQLRVQQLARHKERLELHRVVAVRQLQARRAEQEKLQRRQHKQEADLLHTQQQQQQQQQQQLQREQHNTPRTTLPQPAHRHIRHTTSRLPASVPASPRTRPPALSWLYDELQRRLRALGDVSVAPLCTCSRGGGRGGVGRGLAHVAGCEWAGRDEAYAMRLLERVQELERVQAEQEHEDEGETEQRR